MFTNRLKQVVLSVAFLATSLVAGDSKYTYDTTSLVGIEGGYNSVVSEITDTTAVVGSPGYYSQNTNGLFHGGLKIGAETRDIRFFLSARTYMDSGDYYSSMFTYGAELQYKFNVNKFMNLYLGANTGFAEVSYSRGNSNVKMNKPYMGADIGTNFHMHDIVDLEFGVRYVSIEGTGGLANTVYRLNNIATGYASLIFKWKMD